MAIDELLSWYETNLSTKERKVRGHFSTPPALVEQILDTCGYTSEQNLSRIRVLDPACGSGNFLASAARRLLFSLEQRGTLHRQYATLVQRNIWGFDPDPVACFLAEMQVRTTFTHVNITGSSAVKQPPSLHIHQADALAFPWGERKKVDLFLANPPYLAAKNSDLSGYRFAKQGQSDSYLLFLHLALEVVRPGGWIGLVLPDPFLARTNAARARQRLLSETTIHALWHLSNVFSASVGAVVLIAQKYPPPQKHVISWKREQWQHSSLLTTATHIKNEYNASLIMADAEERAVEKQYVAQTLLRRQAGSELRYFLSQAEGTLLEDVHARMNTPDHLQLKPVFAHLDKFVLIYRGEEIGKDNSLLLHAPTAIAEGNTPASLDASQWHPVLRGGVDVRPYVNPIARYWIRQDATKKPLDRYLAPKLLIVKSVERLQAVLDLQGHIVLQTLYLLQLRLDRPMHQQPVPFVSGDDKDELYFLLALLNSRLLQEYVYVLHTAYKLVQPQIEQHVLAHLPIPLHVPPQEKAQIVQRAKRMTEVCSSQAPVVELKEQNKALYQMLYEEQERNICDLYRAALSSKPHTFHRKQRMHHHALIDKGVKEI